MSDVMKLFIVVTAWLVIAAVACFGLTMIIQPKETTCIDNQEYYRYKGENVWHWEGYKCMPGDKE